METRYYLFNFSRTKNKINNTQSDFFTIYLILVELKIK